MLAAPGSDPDGGIERHYLYGLAVDPGDPDTVIVSAAASPMAAHSREVANSTVYRRSGQGPWREVREGLPEPKGSLLALLAANVDEQGVFHAVNNRGVFRSADEGASWEPLLAPLPDRHCGRSPNAMVVTP